MKDNWIIAFQEKMGDYELDLPATRHRTRRIVLFCSGAAAAALLSVLLLRTPDAGPSYGIDHLIAEVPASVMVSMPGDPAAILRSGRSARTLKTAPADRAERAEPTEKAEIGLQDERPERPEEWEVPETLEVPVVEPEPEKSTGNEPEWWENEEESPSRRTAISARLHVNPLGLQVGTTPSYSKIDAGLPLSATGLEQQHAAFVTHNTANENNAVRNDLTEARCDLPVKTGISARVEGPGRFSFESGLNYNLHRAKVAQEGNAFPAYGLEYRMHYLGIPLKGIFSLAEWKILNLYATAGCEIEWMFSGRLFSQAGGQTVAVQPLKEHPFLFSLTGSAGAEYKFNSRLGLYVEPGIAWHAKPQGNLPNYYREHPLSFDLHVGLRFNLN